MDSSHRTEEVTCSTSRARTASGPSCGQAVTLEMTGTEGVVMATPANSAWSLGWALAMSGE